MLISRFFFIALLCFSARRKTSNMLLYTRASDGFAPREPLKYF
jgi:hypothetical protein